MKKGKKVEYRISGSFSKEKEMRNKSKSLEKDKRVNKDENKEKKKENYLSYMIEVYP